MRLMALAFLFLLSTNCNGQSVDEKNTPFTEMFCGKLVHSLSTPGKPDHDSPLRGNVVRLYPANDSSQCCTGRSPIAQTTTGRGGSFQLQGKDVRSGSYWVAVEVDAHEYKLLVRYFKTGEPRQRCSQRKWTINREGDFLVTQFINVD